MVSSGTTRAETVVPFHVCASTALVLYMEVRRISAVMGTARAFGFHRSPNSHISSAAFLRTAAVRADIIACMVIHIETPYRIRFSLAVPPYYAKRVPPVSGQKKKPARFVKTTAFILVIFSLSVSPLIPHILVRKRQQNSNFGIEFFPVPCYNEYG